MSAPSTGQTYDDTSVTGLQAAQPAYMKTGSGRVVELAGTDEAETSVKEVESLSNTYQATVRPGLRSRATFPSPDAHRRL